MGALAPAVAPAASLVVTGVINAGIYLGIWQGHRIQQINFNGAKRIFKVVTGATRRAFQRGYIKLALGDRDLWKRLNSIRKEYLKEPPFFLYYENSVRTGKYELCMAMCSAVTDERRRLLCEFYCNLMREE